MSELQWQLALYHLRSQIISGDLPGGTKLRASHLAADMGVSRTPVSEALIKLEGEGLLVRDKSGFTVRSFAVDEVFDAIDLRGLLEGAAVQKAAQAGVSDADLQALHTQLSQLDGAIAQNDVAAYDELNLQFHQRLVELSGSDILIAEVQRSYRLPFAGPSAWPTRQSDSSRFRASLIIGQQHHVQIVAAVAAREGGRAFALMCEHARLAHQNVYAAIEAHERSPQLALVKNTTA
ncbi:MAG: GntR family transcriptional regulator [Pseudomonadota bacterium]